MSQFLPMATVVAALGGKYPVPRSMVGPTGDPHEGKGHGGSTFTRSPKAGCRKRRGRRGRR